MTVHLVLPYPPTANLYWRNFRGRIVKSSDARKFAHEVARRCVDSGLRLGAPAFPVGFVRVSIAVYRPRKIGDLDNTLKVLLDALRGLVFTDDKQVVRIAAERRDDRENPRAEVWIDEVTT